MHRDAGSSPRCLCTGRAACSKFRAAPRRVVAAVTERMRSVSNTRLPSGTCSANPLISRPAAGQGCYTISNLVTDLALARGSGHSHRTSARGKWLFLLVRRLSAEILTFAPLDKLDCEHLRFGRGAARRSPPTTWRRQHSVDGLFVALHTRVTSGQVGGVLARNPAYQAVQNSTFVPSPESYDQNGFVTPKQGG